MKQTLFRYPDEDLGGSWIKGEMFCSIFSSDILFRECRRAVFLNLALVGQPFTIITFFIFLIMRF